MRYHITHKTLYSYNEAVTLCHNEAHLIPRTDSNQICLSNEILIEPPPSVYQVRSDFFGNQVCYFSIQTPHKTLSVLSRSEVEVQRSASLNSLANSLPWETARQLLRESLDLAVLEAREFVMDSPFVVVNRALNEYAFPSFTPYRPIIEAARDLMERIFTEFNYDPDVTTVVTPLSEVLEHKHGVCQDFAHLMIGCVRSMGLSARYVSGYLETLPPPGQQKLQGSDASHAWMGVYVPNCGWVDFDPTNNQIPSDQHITTAWGRDYSDVTPLKGIIFGGGQHILNVSVDVERQTFENGRLRR